MFDIIWKHYGKIGQIITLCFSITFSKVCSWFVLSPLVVRHSCHNVTLVYFSCMCAFVNVCLCACVPSCVCVYPDLSPPKLLYLWMDLKIIFFVRVLFCYNIPISHALATGGLTHLYDG